MWCKNCCFQSQNNQTVQVGVAGIKFVAVGKAAGVITESATVGVRLGAVGAGVIEVADQELLHEHPR